MDYQLLMTVLISAYGDLGPNWILDSLDLEHGNMIRESLRNQISG